MTVCRPSKPKIALAVGYMLLILATSMIPMDRDIKSLQFIIDLKPAIQNLLHIPMFAILAILLLQLLKNHHIEGRRRMVLVIFSCVCFGFMNELIQLAIPGRYAGLLDMVFNIIGVFAGIILYVLAEKSKPGLVRRIICS